ncbi:MAG: metal-dependent hydrolase [Reichenbachiella sp.]|uniref:metal-dependent hydrolase n=1 Tax=Reichenbachiella sp. TaxID=2184521 RepID=UPI003267A443
MASAFGHAIIAVSIKTGFPQKHFTPRVLLVGVCCTILPDIDVLAFKFGIAYGSFWGHRGFSHSILFALLIGVICATLFSIKKGNWKSLILLWSYFFICTASHALLDSMTNGGLGVAFFSPWDNTRYFLPWRPIAVSPIGAARFFSARGLEVLKSEAIWIGIPSLIFWGITYISFKRK